MIFKQIRESLQRQVAGTPFIEYLAMLAGDSLVYFGGTVMIGLGQYILLPIYIRALTTAEFGIYALIEITILIAATAGQLGLHIGYLKWFADLPATDRPALLSTASLMSAFGGTVTGVLFAIIVASPMGGTWLTIADRGFAWMLAPIVALESLQGILLADLRARRKAVLYSMASFVRLLVMAGATIWFVPIRGLGLYGIFLGRLAGDGACVAMLLFSVARILRPVFARRIAGPLLRYGTPLVWSSVMGLMMDATGRYFLGYYGMFKAVAIYTVGIKLANTVGIVFLRPFGTAWGSISFQMYHREDAPAAYTKILGYAFVGVMVVAAFVVLAGPLLIAVLASNAYMAALQVLPLLVLPQAFRILEYWTTLPFYLTRRTGWIAAMSTASVTVLVLLNALLVPAFGATGAALSWVGSLAVVIIAQAFIGLRYYPLPLSWGPFTFAMGIWMFAMVLSFATSAVGGLVRVLLTTGAASIIVVGTLCYMLRDLRTARIAGTDQSLRDT